MCDYILIISKGKLVASDTPDRLEAQMSGAETVEILAKADTDLVREILREIVQIKKEIRNGQMEPVPAKITAEDGADIRETVFFAFANRQCPLLSLYTSKISLEDYF